jgi:hypothetical protein
MPLRSIKSDCKKSLGGGAEIYIIIKSFCIKEIITFTSVLYRYMGSQRDQLPEPLYARLTSCNNFFLRI